VIENTQTHHIAVNLISLACNGRTALVGVWRGQETLMVGIVEGTRMKGGGQGGKVEEGTIMLGNVDIYPAKEVGSWQVHHPCKCLAHVI